MFYSSRLENPEITKEINESKDPDSREDGFFENGRRRSFPRQKRLQNRVMNRRIARCTRVSLKSPKHAFVPSNIFFSVNFVVLFIRFDSAAAAAVDVLINTI